MNVKSMMFAAVIGLAATPMMAAADENRSGVQQAGDYISDAALTTKVKSALAVESELSAIDISVESTDNVVSLTGNVDNEAQIELAERVVKDLDGVKSVHNKLKTK